MPATTSKGLPYPVGTDRVMDGDDQIRKLAQGVENYVQSGIVTVNVTAADTTTTQVVTFPVPFAETPTVVVSSGSTPPAAYGLAIWASVGPASVTIGVRRSAAANVTVHWVAVGKITPPT